MLIVACIAALRELGGPSGEYAGYFYRDDGYNLSLRPYLMSLAAFLYCLRLL